MKRLMAFLENKVCLNHLSKIMPSSFVEKVCLSWPVISLLWKIKKHPFIQAAARWSHPTNTKHFLSLNPCFLALVLQHEQLLCTGLARAEHRFSWHLCNKTQHEVPTKCFWWAQNFSSCRRQKPRVLSQQKFAIGNAQSRSKSYCPDSSVLWQSSVKGPRNCPTSHLSNLLSVWPAALLWAGKDSDADTVNPVVFTTFIQFTIPILLLYSVLCLFSKSSYIRKPFFFGRDSKKRMKTVASVYKENKAQV